MKRKIYFDMDGTLCDFYNVPEWLECLQKADVTPYKVAKPLIDKKTIEKLKKIYIIGIISWSAKKATPDFSKRIKKTKIDWIEKNYPNIFDEINIIPYGVPKNIFNSSNDILFDDEKQNRQSWKNCGGQAYDEKDIEKIIKSLL